MPRRSSRRREARGEAELQEQVLKHQEQAAFLSRSRAEPEERRSPMRKAEADARSARTEGKDPSISG
ncbi:uncharacterized protein UV8b_01016 [Ustilaginoidea virens]|uniref:Uncharacterized protein n=1 Tax=Ustilaginoidea virens TaxID=1159556 RepID=A0A8E5HJV4_USTVR|nr:uncharacterized protein UV8b_01016 [Ustilaginoidea virens]QUC16775.1 hypothetical protein UV8b_01016 [Ustilaginoidea virens]